MNAIEAREKIKNIKLNKHNELEKIYGKITEAVDFGWHNTFISEFNISIENGLKFACLRHSLTFD